MIVESRADDEQTRLWNGSAGRAWVETQEVLDQMFKPFENLLMEAVLAGRGGRLLDIGCGTGSTTLAAARLLGAKGHCIGIDISDPMIAAARAHAGREGTSARFIRANAQIHPFEPASFDMIISRFGVMFFDEPVRAFANLRRAARDEAGLRFIAWRSAAENPFMTTAERAVVSLANQKRYMSLYLLGVYGDEGTQAWLRERWAATGKKLDMGKACVRFKRSGDRPEMR